MQYPRAFESSRLAAVALFVLATTACSTLHDQQPTLAVQPDESALAVSDCRIIYDAGSSGTRLYVYEKTDAGWEQHEGPKVSALADPVREIRGKKWSDVDKVVSEVVGALPAMLKDGPVKDAEPAWKAFDWRGRCRIASASVFATAGMRIAEQLQRDRSEILWKRLSDQLAGVVGGDVEINTRTLSGFEEGLFTWLALVETAGTTDFGIAEMGGASAQVTFPCPACDPDSDRVRTIQVAGKPILLFSYSFLGLGSDEAQRTLGFPMSCRYGIGALNSSWTPAHCQDRIRFTDANGDFYDPYNFSDGTFGIDTKSPTDDAEVSKWYLTGGFAYMDDDEIDRCCATEGECPFQTESSCFRAVYLRKYLSVLDLDNTAPSRASWTKGANLCLAEDCLAPARPAPICRWSAEGCLGN